MLVLAKEFENNDDVDNDGLKDKLLFIMIVKMIMMILKSLVQKLQKYYMLQKYSYNNEISG